MRTLITGGGSDIGFAIAKSLVQRGDFIIVTASNKNSLESMVDRYRQAKLDVTAIIFNLSEPEANPNNLNTAFDEGIDAVVLNAWSRMPANKRLHEFDDQFFNHYMQTNVSGNTWLLKKCLTSMDAQNFGRIAFISSMSVPMGTGRYGPYIAGKSAIEGLIKNIAMDYGQNNIYANTVRLGIFKTERNRKYWQRGEYDKRMSAIIPCGRLGLADEAAEIFHPILSKQQYINGSCIEVSGGLPGISFSGVLSS